MPAAWTAVNPFGSGRTCWCGTAARSAYPPPATSADQIADRKAGHAVTERGDPAGDFEAWNIRRSRWRRIFAEPLQHVGTIDARGIGVDQHLASGGTRIRTFGDLQNITAPAA